MPEGFRWKQGLLVLPAAIASAQITLLFQTGPGAGNFLVINLLAWFCAITLWTEHVQLLATPAWARTAPVALLLLVWSLLVISRTSTIYDPLLNAVPLATLVALALLLRSPLRLSLVLLGLLPALHYAVINLTPTDLLAQLTADLSAQLLWLGGIPVLAQGDQLLLQGRSLVVGAGCTGLNVLSLSLASVLALILLNGALSWRRTLLLALVAPLLAFVINAVRIAMLCLMPAAPAGSTQMESAVFSYWHTGGGSMLFSLALVLLLFAVEHRLRQGD